jgi:glycosyltransferase involved in cell wall biosynthesis
MRAKAGARMTRRKRILVLCPYPHGVAAGQRLKFEQYYDDWRRAGWDVVASPFMGRRLWDVLFEPGHLPTKALGVLKGSFRRLRDMARIPRYDLVYVFMYVTPVGSTIFERLTRVLARKLIYDVEDNVMAHVGRVGNNHPNPILRVLRGTGKYRFLVREADHVVTSSPALNERCKSLNRHGACTYISSSVDAERFTPAGRYSNDTVVTIGWTGTFSSRPYLDLLRRVFQELAGQRRFRLRVIGNFDYELPGVDLEVLRWSSEREVADLQAIDIGIYPLPLDDWVAGKSGLKAITYMMMGLPCVATDVGTTPMIIRDGENGLVVSTEDEWLQALKKLIDDPDLRRRLGETARRDATSKYSTRAIAAAYRRVLASVMDDAGHPASAKSQLP